MQKNLARIDLNLLIALQVLLEERNVTRAAEQLYITQPAMSKTLQRLRELFDDPLFTRTARGLVPTPRAEQLVEPLAVVLEQLESTIFSADFDPAKVRETISIATPGTVATGAIPYLLSRIAQPAPYLSIRSFNVVSDYMEQLASGTLDFAVYLENTNNNDVVSSYLSSSGISCWVSETHELASRQSLTLDEFCHYPHVVLALPHINDHNQSPLDKMLENEGRTRQIILRTTQLFTALETLQHSKAIMVGPEYLNEFDLIKGHVTALSVPDLPAFAQLETPLYLVQHRRTQNSPLHCWIRDQLQSIFREFKAMSEQQEEHRALQKLL